MGFCFNPLILKQALNKILSIIFRFVPPGKGNKMFEKTMKFSGTISENLKALKEKIRKDPAKPELRTYLFQLLCITGDYQRAMTQLNVAGDMDDANKLMAKVCGPLLNCEVLREAIFKGRHSPLIFGEPEPWMGQMIQALILDAKNKHNASKKLREKALDQAEAIPGTINGDPFEWLADADSRLGPVFEIIIEGKFYFTALSNIKKMIISEPYDLRDVLWLPASVVWKNDGQSVGFIPARYQGTIEEKEDALLLCRKTIWNQVEEDVYFGRGQKMLTTEQKDYPIMDVREITFNH